MRVRARRGKKALKRVAVWVQHVANDSMFVFHHEHAVGYHLPWTGSLIPSLTHARPEDHWSVV